MFSPDVEFFLNVWFNTAFVCPEATLHGWRDVTILELMLLFFSISLRGEETANNAKVYLNWKDGGARFFFSGIIVKVPHL